MRYQGHLLVGLLVLLIFIQAYQYLVTALTLPQTAVLLPLTLLYSLLPDLDNPSSKIKKLFTRVLLTSSLVLLAIYYFSSRVYVLASALVSLVLLLLLSFTRHRGRFHSLPAGLVLSSPLLLLGTPYFLVAFLAYLSHLTVD